MQEKLYHSCYVSHLKALAFILLNLSIFSSHYFPFYTYINGFFITCVLYSKHVKLYVNRHGSAVGLTSKPEAICSSCSRRLHFNFIKTSHNHLICSLSEFYIQGCPLTPPSGRIRGPEFFSSSTLFRQTFLLKTNCQVSARFIVSFPLDYRHIILSHMSVNHPPACKPYIKPHTQK
jgi:hypothetical protein